MKRNIMYARTDQNLITGKYTLSIIVWPDDNYSVSEITREDIDSPVFTIDLIDSPDTINKSAVLLIYEIENSDEGGSKSIQVILRNETLNPDPIGGGTLDITYGG